MIHIHARVFSSGNDKEEIIKLKSSNIDNLEQLRNFCDCFSRELFINIVQYLGMTEELKNRK